MSLLQRKRPVIRVGPRLAGLPPDEPAQAPAVAVLEPESAPVTPVVKVPPIMVIPPHKADAKPAPRSAISPDIRKKIEESLASVPGTAEKAVITEQIETSEGFKTLSARE